MKFKHEILSGVAAIVCLTTGCESEPPSVENVSQSQINTALHKSNLKREPATTRIPYINRIVNDIELDRQAEVRHPDAPPITNYNPRYRLILDGEKAFIKYNQQGLPTIAIELEPIEICKSHSINTLFGPRPNPATIAKVQDLRNRIECK
jgi:hypothetical protein